MVWTRVYQASDMQPACTWACCHRTTMLVGDELLLLPKSAITIDHDSEGFASFSDFYTFRADHNGLSHLQVLVHQWRHSRRGLGPRNMVHHTKPSFGPGIVVGSPREVPPASVHVGLVHLAPKGPDVTHAYRPHCWMNLYAPLSDVGTNTTIN